MTYPYFSPFDSFKSTATAEEHKNALVFLTNLASKVGDDAKDLKVTRNGFRVDDKPCVTLR